MNLVNTYISNRQNKKYVNKYNDINPILQEFIRYVIAIQGLSQKTANTYYVNLRQYMRYLVMLEKDYEKEDFEYIPIADVKYEMLTDATEETILEYLYFLAEMGLSPSSRSNKLSAIKSFYKYVCNKYPQDFPVNPAHKIDRPKIPKKLPVHLSESEAIRLIKASLKTSSPERDYCILTLFLNCGMRLSELVGINISDIGTETLRIEGKGHKQRTVYLNDACLSALNNWKLKRNEIANIIDVDALFISDRTRQRLTQRGIEKMLDRVLRDAGLDGQGISPHKLRHTAATLLYNSGADLLELKQILGHEHTTTTEIYTHLNNARLKEVADHSPLNVNESTQEMEEI